MDEIIAAIDNMGYPVLVTRLENEDGDEDGSERMCRDRYLVLQELCMVGLFELEGYEGEGLSVQVEWSDLDALEAAWETPREAA